MYERTGMRSAGQISKKVCGIRAVALKMYLNEGFSMPFDHIFGDLSNRECRSTTLFFFLSCPKSHHQPANDGYCNLIVPSYATET